MPYKDPVAARLASRERVRRYHKRQSLAKKLGPSAVELAGDPADVLAAWSASTLVVPAGHPNAGEPMTLPDYGVEFLRARGGPKGRPGGDIPACWRLLGRRREHAGHRAGWQHGHVAVDDHSRLADAGLGGCATNSNGAGVLARPAVNSRDKLPHGRAVILGTAERARQRVNDQQPRAHPSG